MPQFNGFTQTVLHRVELLFHLIPDFCMCLPSNIYINTIFGQIISLNLKIPLRYGTDSLILLFLPLLFIWPNWPRTGRFISAAITQSTTCTSLTTRTSPGIVAMSANIVLKCLQRTLSVCPISQISAWAPSKAAPAIPCGLLRKLPGNTSHRAWRSFFETAPGTISGHGPGISAMGLRIRLCTRRIPMRRPAPMKFALLWKIRGGLIRFATSCR